MSDRDAPPVIEAREWDGKMYILHISDGPLKEAIGKAHPTPGEAYQDLIDHEGEGPPDGEPDWPDHFGDDVWGWSPDDGSRYTISEWEWSGKDTVNEWLTESEVKEQVNDE